MIIIFFSPPVVVGLPWWRKESPPPLLALQEEGDNREATERGPKPQINGAVYIEYIFKVLEMYPLMGNMLE